MRKSAALSFVLLPLILCGCPDGAKNIRAIKATDYDTVPKHILFVIPKNAIMLAHFRQVLGETLAKCGATAQFITDYDPADARMSHFDAVMLSQPLGIEQTTAASCGVAGGCPQACRVG